MVFRLKPVHTPRNSSDFTVLEAQGIAHTAGDSTQLKGGAMDRFVRLEREKQPEPPAAENVMRITNTGRMRSYISYATNLLEEKGLSSVVLEGMGRAINKTVTVVEILKRRVRGLHQNTEISSVDIIDCWEPLEEGLHRLETKRAVSMVTITLSKTLLDTASPGYQEPLPDDQVFALTGHVPFANAQVYLHCLDGVHEDYGWVTSYA
jgi:DNA-binding protein